MKKIRALILFVAFSQCCLAQHWDSLYGGLNRNVTYLYDDTVYNKLYIGGEFTMVNHQPMWGIATWSNSQWDSVGYGIDPHTTVPGSTWAITRYGNYIYAGGNFSVAGHRNAFCFARWDGSNWDTIPGGQPDGVIRGMCVYNNELYVCGNFHVIGGVSANAVAKWNGTNWQAIGNNYNFPSLVVMNRVIFYNGNLYLSGTFDDPNGNPCRLAKWNGSNWRFFTNDIVGGLAGIWDMEVYNNELYVGGLFYASDGNKGTSIMRWNDTTWNAVGGSVQGGSINPYPTVMDMCVHNGKLYCAGNFEKIGGIKAMGLASWDGIDWCGYKTFFADDLHQYDGLYYMAFHNDTMYVTGAIRYVDGDSLPQANYNLIAKWIGGNYLDTCGVISTGIEDNLDVNDFSVFPNPANDLIAIQLNNLNGHNLQIKIIDVLGQTVIEKKEEDVSGSLEELINVSGLNAGVYFITVQIDNRNMIARRIIIQR